MPDWDVILSELGQMRSRLDQLAAVAMSHKTREELMPVWDCGHRHQGRQEAIDCKRSQRAHEAASVDDAA